MLPSRHQSFRRQGLSLILFTRASHVKALTSIGVSHMALPGDHIYAKDLTLYGDGDCCFTMIRNDGRFSAFSGDLIVFMPESDVQQSRVRAE